MLFTVRIWGASSYETHRANDTASILVMIDLWVFLNFGRYCCGTDVVSRSESYGGFCFGGVDAGAGTKSVRTATAPLRRS